MRSFKKKTLALFLCIALVLVGVTACIMSPYEWIGSANINEVRERVIPSLQQAVQDKGFTWGSPLFIRIFKQDKQLEVWLQKSDGQYSLFKSYPICTYSGELGGKTKEGDGQAPEGFYSVGISQMKPDSRYHLAFNIGFPNVYDTARGYTGTFLMVHGNCVSVGCYAMTNKGIEEIYLLADTALQHGQQNFSVHIFPFALTEDNLQHYQTSKWYPFWQELKKGYDAFERNHFVPLIQVKNGQYIVHTH